MRFLIMVVFGIIFNVSGLVAVITGLDWLADGITIFTQAETLFKESALIAVGSLIMLLMATFGFQRRILKPNKDGWVKVRSNIGLMSSIRKRLGE